MQIPRRSGGRVIAMCPCTQPPFVLDGLTDGGTRDTEVAPLPETDTGSYLLTAQITGAPVLLKNCRQDYLSYTVATRPDRRVAMTAVRLLPERHYVIADAAAAVAAHAGAFVSDSCAATQPMAIPAGYAGSVDLLVVLRQSDSLSSDWYARLAPVDATRTITIKEPPVSSISLRICPSCEAPEQMQYETCVSVNRGGGDVTMNVSGPEVVVQVHYAGLPAEVTAPSTVTFLTP